MMCEHKFQKCLLKKDIAFLQENFYTPIKKDFALFHIKFDPLNLPDFKRNQCFQTP